MNVTRMEKYQLPSGQEVEKEDILLEFVSDRNDPLEGF